MQHQAKGGDVKPIQQDIVMFKCSICAKSFKLRKARDHHEKNHQKSTTGTPEPVKKTNSTDNMAEGGLSEQRTVVFAPTPGKLGILKRE